MYQTTSSLHLIVLCVGLVLAVADVVAIVLTARDRTMPLSTKVPWVIAILILPVLGVVAWFVVRATRHRRAAA